MPKILSELPDEPRDLCDSLRRKEQRQGVCVIDVGWRGQIRTPPRTRREVER